MKFASLVKELRINRGLTQTEFAELVGCSLQSIAYYENGTRYPALKIIRRLSEIGGIDVKKVRKLIESEKKKRGNKNDNHK